MLFSGQLKPVRDGLPRILSRGGDDSDEELKHGKEHIGLGWQHDEPLVKNCNEKILHLANKGEVISELARTGEHHSSESKILSISDVVAMRGLGAKSSESSIVASKSSTVPTAPRSAFSKV